MNWNTLRIAQEGDECLVVEELIRRRAIALGAIAEINANLENGLNMPPESRKELEESRELFHGDLEQYGVELTELGIAA